MQAIFKEHFLLFLLISVIWSSLVPKSVNMLKTGLVKYLLQKSLKIFYILQKEKYDWKITKTVIFVCKIAMLLCNKILKIQVSIILREKEKRKSFYFS